MSAELKRGESRRLPSRRFGFTVEVTIGEQVVILNTGEFEDGTLGEIFARLPKADSLISLEVSVAAIAISKGLQHGVPLEEFVDSFVFIRSEPMGAVVGHPNIKTATSIWDFFMRVLGHHYLGRQDLVQVPGASQIVSELSSSGSSVSNGVHLDEAVMQAVTSETGGAVDRTLTEMMGDAPFCNVCGHVTMRIGQTYKCLNCGNTDVK